MKIYIGLGGIGCRVLSDFQNNTENDGNSLFYYIDCDVEALRKEKKAYTNYYCVQPTNESENQRGERTFRNIEKNAIDFEIQSNKLDFLFFEIERSQDAELVFCLSSFGGFGGAVIFKLLEHLKERTVSYSKCSVFVFNEKSSLYQSFPKPIKDYYEINTYQFISDYSEFNKNLNPNQPECEWYLINTSGLMLNNFYMCLEFTEEQLGNLNFLSDYPEIGIESGIKPPKAVENKKSKNVFISYSSIEQSIADRLCDSLIEAGNNVWIASRSIKEGSFPRQIVQGIKKADVFIVIVSKNSVSSEHVKSEIDIAFDRLKDGLTIIPFIIDDAELDEDCQYYLKRQEAFFGNKPPIHKRIKELTERIQAVEIEDIPQNSKKPRGFFDRLLHRK